MTLIFLGQCAFLCIIKPLSHINGIKGFLLIKNVTKAEVQSYDGLMEGGIFLVEVHVVQKGDTLWKISRQYGISFEDLKRVNAHLANPDYVVPGMKIFLPDAVKGKGEVKQPTTSSGQVQKTEKAPVKKAIPPKVEKEVSKQPIPIPEVPTPPKVPTKPSVEAKPVPPKKTPPLPVEPVSPPVQSQPIPPMPMPMPMPMQPYPVIGIPCGWMPIYDADCYPHIHPSQMQPMPAPMQQLPVQPESSHFPGHHLPTKPSKPQVTDDWKMIESPRIEDEFTVQPPKRHEPKPMPEAMPEPLPIPLPQPIPQYEMPMTQPIPQFEMPMSQPITPIQQNHWRCMQCGVQPNYSGHSIHCGCGSFQQMPMTMPLQPSSHCNSCQQPMQRMPQMMPYPNQNTNWYGMH